MVKNLQVVNQEKTKKGKLTKIFLAGVLVGTFAFGIPKVMDALEKDKIQDELKEEFKDFDSFSTLEVASLDFWLEDEEFAKQYNEHKELAFILAPISQDKLKYAYNQIIEWAKTHYKYINFDRETIIDEYGFKFDLFSQEFAIRDAFVSQFMEMNRKLEKIDSDLYNFTNLSNNERDEMEEQLHKIIFEGENVNPSEVTLEMHPRTFMFRYATYYRTLSNAGIDFRTMELKSDVDIITR